MKDARKFEGILTDKNSSELSGKKRLLDFKLERGTEERRSYKQHCRIFPCDHGPRGADALP